MAENPVLREELKAVLVEELMLQEGPETIGDDTPLFGANGLGLDSVDALQLVVALEKRYGLKLSDAEAAKNTLQSVATIASAVAALRAQSPGETPFSSERLE